MMFQVWCWTSPEENNVVLYITFSLNHWYIFLFLCVCNLQPTAGCHIYDLERPAAVSPDLDINHTDLEERVGFIKCSPVGHDGRKIYRTREGLFTFGVISGVKLKQFDRVIWKTVHIDPVL